MKKIIKNNKIMVVILSCIVTIALALSMDKANAKSIAGLGNNSIAFFLANLNNSINKDVFISVLIFILSYVFLKKRYNDDITSHKKSVITTILSIMISVCMIVGESYAKTNSWDLIFDGFIQMFKFFIKFIGYYIIIKVLIDYLFNKVFERINFHKKSSNVIFNFIFEKHSFIIPLLIILICWMPYFISFYPGMLVPDSCNQIKQFYGMDISKNSSTNSTNLIDENVKITNHHSVAHTVTIGLCMKAGQLIKNDNLGVFLCTIIQASIFITALSYSIYFMGKINVNNKLRAFTLAIYAILPIFPLYAIEITKDTIFVSLLIFYIIQLYKILCIHQNKKISFKNSFITVLLSISLCLFRNNGIYVIMLSLPVVAFIDRNNRKRIVSMSAIILILYESYVSVLLPTLKIPGTGVREMLSVPFQQTARYVKEYDSEVTREEKEIIDNVLVYKTLKNRYKPDISDPVKNKFNKDSTKEDLKKYFEVWFDQLKKHPTVYIQAYINNYYGYLYPEKEIYGYTENYVVDHCNSLKLTGKFNYHYIKKLRNEREIINQIIIFSETVPVLSWLTNIAFNSWLLISMAVYLIYRKKCRYIIILLPSISILLICFVSPVNNYFRYAMPYIFNMPLVFSIFINIINSSKKIN